MGVYDRGQTVRLVASFIASSAASPFMTEPASVFCVVRDPVGSLATYAWTSGDVPSVIRTATGAYYCDVIASIPGVWEYAFSTGPVTSGALTRGVGRFTIRVDDIF